MSNEKDEITTKKRKKYKERTDDHELSPYNRRQILEQLTELGYNEKSIRTIKNRFRKSRPGAIEGYINNHASNSQRNVPEECNFTMFESLNNWAEYFKETKLADGSCYDLALQFKAIANCEKHPDPNATGGIDFEHLYRFLSDVMKGHPTIQLNEATQNFLREAFEELENAVESQEGIKDLRKLKMAIKENGNTFAIPKSMREVPESLDPLNVDVKLVL